MKASLGPGYLYEFFHSLHGNMKERQCWWAENKIFKSRKRQEQHLCKHNFHVNLATVCVEDLVKPLHYFTIILLWDYFPFGDTQWCNLQAVILWSHGEEFLFLCLPSLFIPPTPDIHWTLCHTVIVVYLKLSWSMSVHSTKMVLFNSQEKQISGHCWLSILQQSLWRWYCSPVNIITLIGHL